MGVVGTSDYIAETFIFLTVRFDGQNSLPAFRTAGTIFSSGLRPLILDAMFQTVLKIYEEREMTLLLVEQNTKWALSVSSRSYILENDAITLEGESSDLEVLRFHRGTAIPSSSLYQK